jgi:hypothetical protein
VNGEKEDKVEISRQYLAGGIKITTMDQRAE